MSEATKVVGLVCAAGVGSRMGLGSPKQYMKFGSEAMLVHTVRALRAVERMGEIVVVVSPTDPYIDDVARHFPENVRVLRCGGRERAESVVNGLLNAGFDRDAWVLVHDAARPCLKPSEAARLIDEVLADGGVSGGILAVTLTDAVQYVIIVIGVTLCAYLAIDHLGGFDAMMSILYSNPRFETNMKPLANWSLVQFLGLFFSFLLGEFCAPYYIQRYASTKSAKDSKNGLLIFGVHWIFFMATTAAIGLASMAIQPDVKPDLAFTNLIRDILPPGITGLVFGALLAAVMSTGAAMINTSAVIYTRDIYNKFINTAATQAQLLRQSRLSTLVVGGISIGVAIIFQDVFGLMIYMFKLWPSAILPPLMCGLLWGKISPYAGAPAVIAGGLSFFLWSDKVLGEPFGIPANFIGIGMNCLVLFFVHQKMKGHKPEGPFLPDLN